jgi:hypothetical protein
MGQNRNELVQNLRTVAQMMKDGEAVFVAGLLLSAAEAIEALEKPDLFWLADDPEYFHNDLEEFLGYGECEPGSFREILVGRSLPNCWVVFSQDENGEHRMFASMEEAEDWKKKRERERGR